MDNNNMYNQDQPQFRQQPYQQAPYQEPGELEEPVSFGDWMITMLIMSIPCVNIVMMFVWAFGNGNKSKSNYFKAYLVWALISIVISVILVAVFGASIAALLNSTGYNGI